MINPTNKNELRYVGNEKWLVISNNETIAEYLTTDLRISLVWRQRCFDEVSEIQKWKDQQKNLFTVQFVLERFIEDMK